MSWRTFAFFVAVALALYARLEYRASYFPPVFEGEQAKVLDLAKDTCDYAAYTGSWWQAFRGGVIEYNKGFAWVLVPFYLIFGYDVRLVTYVIPVIYSLLCAAFLTLYRKAYPKASLLSFVIPLVFSVLCVALRRYKWHVVAFMPAIATYLYFLPVYYSGPFFLRDRWRKALALLLFLLSCYLYFGSLLYVVPFLLLVFFFSSRAQRRWALAICSAGLALFAVFSAYIYRVNETWHLRIDQETESMATGLTSRTGLTWRMYSLQEFFYQIQLSTPYLVLFLVGSAAAFWRIRKGDRFALITMVLFLPLFTFQMLLSGLNNPDQLNWLMIPLLGILMIGADQILVPLRERLRFGSVIGALVVLAVGWHEMDHFVDLNRDAGYQGYIQDRNTRTQLSLVLMTIKQDRTGSVQYYLPAPSVPEARGGFPYDVALLRLDFVDTLAKVIFFENEDDLRHRLRVQDPGKKAVAFLSVGYPPDGEKDTLNEPLLGHSPEIIHPFEAIYRIAFIVRKFELPAVPLGKDKT